MLACGWKERAVASGTRTPWWMPWPMRPAASRAAGRAMSAPSWTRWGATIAAGGSAPQRSRCCRGPPACRPRRGRRPGKAPSPHRQGPRLRRQALPAAELAAPIVVDAPPPAAPTPLTVTSATELSRGSPSVPSASPSRTVPVRWWAVLACCVVLTGATTWFVATRGDTDRAPLQPPSAPRAIATPPGLDNAVESLRPGPIAVDAPAPDVMPSPPPPAAPSVAPPLLTAASETPKAPDSRAASPQRPAALPIPPSRNTADPRCSDLLTRLSLGQDLNAADAALLERHCR